MARRGWIRATKIRLGVRGRCGSVLKCRSPATPLARSNSETTNAYHWMLMHHIQILRRNYETLRDIVDHPPHPDHVTNLESNWWLRYSVAARRIEKRRAEYDHFKRMGEQSWMGLMNPPAGCRSGH